MKLHPLERRALDNARLLRRLLLTALLMFGFGFALVPLYQVLCELTGINVLAAGENPYRASPNTQVDASRNVSIEFDVNTNGPIRFRAPSGSVRVHPGEVTQVVFEVHNPQHRSLQAQAIPSYAPQQAAPHFRKIECFCFRQQVLGPNETRQMPLVFSIDPALPKTVTTVTLSYTFFEVGLKNGVAIRTGG
jgi:cytochrome c oxidase assembly protein subunit 11